jgi:hypothetical protein
VDSRPIDIEEGLYEVIFYAISGDIDEYDKYEFIFIKTNNPQAKIIRADTGIKPPKELLLDAKPAT